MLEREFRAKLHYRKKENELRTKTLIIHQVTKQKRKPSRTILENNELTGQSLRGSLAKIGNFRKLFRALPNDQWRLCLLSFVLFDVQMCFW